MNLESRFSAVIVEWAYAREVMRRIGFSADDLFFAATSTPSVQDRETGKITPVNGLVVSLLLRTQNKEFRWVIGTTSMSKDKLQSEYERLCSEWNSGIVDDELTAFKNSQPFKQADKLIEVLQKKGFVLNSY